MNKGIISTAKTFVQMKKVPIDYEIDPKIRI